MATTFHFELNEIDLGRLLDGLKSRAESWKRTAGYLGSETIPDGKIFIIEECSKPEEAGDIADHYRSIIAKVRGQMEVQS